MEDFQQKLYLLNLILMIKKLLAYFYKQLASPDVLRLYKSLRKCHLDNNQFSIRIQRSKLVSVIEDAYLLIPYYKNLGLSVDLSNFSYDEFRKIPLMTKDIIRK